MEETSQRARSGDPVDGLKVCFVPAGPFRMGREGHHEPIPDREQREIPQHELNVPYDFWIGRYPVTVGRFREFVSESGFLPAKPESVVGCASEPVASVSWYEAVAFCKWLGERWRESGRAYGWEVGLPSEAEWEKAARGGLEIPSQPVICGPDDLSAKVVMRANPQPLRRYPWGERLDARSANYLDTEIGGRSPVGSFPSGASPYGCEEMSGNVWEWTRTLWGEEMNHSSFRYPYRAEDGRESLEAGPQVLRVARGGAFDDEPDRMRCAFRVRFLPEERKTGLGFRLILRPRYLV